MCVERLDKGKTIEQKSDAQCGNSNGNNTKWYNEHWHLLRPELGSVCKNSLRSYFCGPVAYLPNEWQPDGIKIFTRLIYCEYRAVTKFLTIALGISQMTEHSHATKRCKFHGVSTEKWVECSIQIKLWKIFSHFFIISLASINGIILTIF